MRPRLAAGLDINQTEDGHVVHQPERDRLHYLNVSAAVLLEVRDGSVCADALPALLAGICGMAAPPTEDVESCLETMMTEGLLLDARPGHGAGGNRHAAIHGHIRLSRAAPSRRARA